MSATMTSTDHPKKLDPIAGGRPMRRASPTARDHVEATTNGKRCARTACTSIPRETITAAEALSQAQAGEPLRRCRVMLATADERRPVTHEDADRFVGRRVADLTQDGDPAGAAAIAQVDGALIRHGAEPGARVIGIAQACGFDREVWDGFTPKQAEPVAFILAGLWDARCADLAGAMAWLHRVNHSPVGDSLAAALIALAESELGGDAV